MTNVSHGGNIRCKGTMVEIHDAFKEPSKGQSTDRIQGSKASMVRTRAGKVGRGKTTKDLRTTRDYIFIIRAMGSHVNVTQEV